MTVNSVKKTIVLLAAAGVTGVASLAALGLAPLAQPQPQAAPALRIGTADVLGIVEHMLASDRYRPAQEAFLKQENDKLRPLADELVALENRGNNLAPNSPDIERLGKEFDDKQQAFQKARQDAFSRIDQYNTDQVREAYRLTLEAVNDLAAKQGYSHVIATRTGDAAIRSQNVPGALQEILARPVVKSNPADDLTDRIVRQFKLENVKVDDADASAPNQPQTPQRAPLPPGR